VELLIDLESQLLTRRFFNTVLDNSHVLVRSRLSALARRQEDDGSDGRSGRLFRQLLDVLAVYTMFEINEETGEARTDSEMTAIHYDQITSLQVRIALHECLNTWFCLVLLLFSMELIVGIEQIM